MAQQPAITVLIAVYNGADSLGPTLHSVQEQGGPDWEMVVVDDGSTDTTASVLRRAAAGDARIRAVTNGTNLGLTRSLGVGLDAARAPLVARLDCGDRMAPGRLAAQARLFALRPELVLAGSRCRVITPDGALICRSRGRAGEVRPTHLLEANPFIHSSVCFRAEAVRAAGGYDDGFRTSQDHELWTRLLLSGAGWIDPLPRVDWVLDPGGISYRRRGLQRRSQALAADLLRRRLAGQDAQVVAAARAEGLATLDAWVPPEGGPQQRSTPYALLCAKAALAQGDAPSARRFALQATPRDPWAAAGLWAASWVPEPVRDVAIRLAWRRSGPR